MGDAVIVTDKAGKITFINEAAEDLTAWTLNEAAARPLAEVFNIVNEHTREIVESPVDKVLREGVVVGLANHTVLIRQDQREIPIDDSGAPIRDEEGNLIGVVLVSATFPTVNKSNWNGSGFWNRNDSPVRKRSAPTSSN